MGQRSQLANLRNKRKLILGISLIGLIAFLFSPLPGIEAVTGTLTAGTNPSSTTAGVTEGDATFTITVLGSIPGSADPFFSHPVFTSGDPETISGDSVIVVVVDENTANQQSCAFSLDASSRNSAMSSNCSAIDIDLTMIEDSSAPGVYQYFGYGYYYAYGQYYNYNGYFQKLIGTGDYGYGLTADVKNDGVTSFGGDVTANYDISIDPLGLAAGTHDLNVKVYNPDGTMAFVLANAIQFTSTNTGTPATVSAPEGGAGVTYTPPNTVTTVTITDTSLPGTVAATAGQALDFSALLTTTGSTRSGTLSTTAATITAGVGGQTIPIAIPAGTVVNGPAGWNGQIAVPTTTTATAPDGETGLAIAVGAGNTRLTFNQAIQITLPGQGFRSQAFFSGTSNNGVVETISLPNCLPFGIETQALATAKLKTGTSLEACFLISGNDMIIFTKHFSSFGSSSARAAGAAASGASSGGSGSVSTAAGGAGGGGGGAAVALVSQVAIYEISYDVCEENMVTVVAGPAIEGINAKLRTSISGVIQMDRAEDQPLSGRTIFEANVQPGETFALVQVEGIESRGASVAQRGVDFTECTGTIKVADYVPPTTPTLVTPSKPFVGAAPAIQGGETFDTTISNLDFTVSYKAQTSATITGIEVDENAKSVTFSLADVGEGEFLLSVPRTLVDAMGDNFVLLVSASPAEPIDFEIVDSTDTYVTFKVMLPEGASAITVIGTNVVPEFGTIAAAVLAVTILSIVALTRYSRFNIPKLQ